MAPHHAAARHYPRPEGYVDPEVLRLRQQADEERELAEARTRFK